MVLAKAQKQIVLELPPLTQIEIIKRRQNRPGNSKVTLPLSTPPSPSLAGKGCRQDGAMQCLKEKFSFCLMEINAQSCCLLDPNLFYLRYPDSLAACVTDSLSRFRMKFAFWNHLMVKQSMFKCPSVHSVLPFLLRLFKWIISLWFRKFLFSFPIWSEYKAELGSAYSKCESESLVYRW